MVCGVLMMVAGCAASHDSSGAAGSARPGSKVTVLLTEPLAKPAATEGRMLTVEYPPGASTPAHHHDGTIFAYVVEGAVITALDDGPEKRFEAGQGWYERPGQVHRVSRNASRTERAKLLVVFLTEAGKAALKLEQ
jgi:quercetin dioxygenase-like cupin family protein